MPEHGAHRPIAGHDEGETNDPALDYTCAAATVTEARSHGLTAELTSYCTESAHAQNLYNAYKDATDEQWTTFLARELGLYGNEPPPTVTPVCTN